MSHGDNLTAVLMVLQSDIIRYLLSSAFIATRLVVTVGRPDL